MCISKRKHLNNNSTLHEAPIDGGFLRSRRGVVRLLAPGCGTRLKLIYDSVIPLEARMTVKTTLSFTDRYHRFLSEKVG